MRLASLFVCLLTVGALAAAPANAQLRTGIVDPEYFHDFVQPQYEQDFDRTTATGAGFVRLTLNWRQVVGDSPEPADPTDPNSSAYNWQQFDMQVQEALDRGLTIIASVQTAPNWGQAVPNGKPNGTVTQPYPGKFAQFGTAAATRYDGKIKLWQVWNEPNRDYFLMPQIRNGVVVSAEIYRKLVNQFGDAVRLVNRDNKIIAGGLAPLGKTNKPAPLRFMKQLLRKGTKTKFDIWSHHPYTSGGPTHKAAGSGNVAIGNLPEMRTLLFNRIKAGRVQKMSPRMQFWVTEFSWDTDLPDPQAVPMKIHARWTSEALYRMWKHGVSLVTWFKIRDEPMFGPKGTHYQSGFFFLDGRKKKSFQAFRFPFVAFRKPYDRIQIWGRTPTSAPGLVRLQIRVNGSWRSLGTVNAKGGGIFKRTVTTRFRNGVVRARFAGEQSVGFSLTPVRDRWVNPFGCGGSIPC